jgi:hypothetical protein
LPLKAVLRILVGADSDVALDGGVWKVGLCAAPGDRGDVAAATVSVRRHTCGTGAIFDHDRCKNVVSRVPRMTVRTDAHPSWLPAVSRRSERARPSEVA